LEKYPPPTGFYTSSLKPFEFFFTPLEKGSLKLLIERVGGIFENQSLSFVNCIDV